MCLNNAFPIRAIFDSGTNEATAKKIIDQVDSPIGGLLRLVKFDPESHMAQIAVNEDVGMPEYREIIEALRARPHVLTADSA